jgi:tetratricopeptide (TPR) repeat protein
VKHSEAALVGRRREVKELLGGVELAREGHGSLYLIAGEPGIGKTRLAEEVAALSRQRGSLVLWSRCWKAAGAPAYRPWLQLVKACIVAKVRDRSGVEIDRAIAEFDRIAPTMGAIVRQREIPALAEDPEETRFRLFDAVLALLKAVSSCTPLVVVLDDLGAADLSSVLLLKYLARELHDSRIFLLATYRDSDMRGSPLLSDALVELSREARTVELHGLSREEVAELVRGEVPISAESADAMARASGGNPFFVQSILKLGPPEVVLQDARNLGQGRIKFTMGLRAAIEGHLTSLSPAGRMVLEIASAIGREFDVNLLAETVGVLRDELLDLVAQAEACGLISPAYEQEGFYYRFVHSLVADGLYEGIPAVERARIHNQIGERIEDLYADDLDAHLGTLAQHFFEGARLGMSDRAREYAERAAARAAEQAAFEEATRFYQMALAAMGVARRADRRHRCELLLAMGEAQRRSADYDGARESYGRASELAAQLGDGPLLAHAALGYPGLSPGVSSPLPDEAIRLLDRALKALPKRDDPWRAMVMARLASELSDRPAATARRRELVEQAVAMARRTGDKSAVATVLEFRDLTLTGPHLLEERFRNAEDITQTAEKIGNHFGIYLGSLARVYCYRQTGDISKAQDEIEAMQVLERIARLSVCRWSAQCFSAYRALLAGRFAEAQHLAREAWEFAERMRGAPSPHIFWPAMMVPYREQGRLGEIESLAIESLRQRPTSVAYRALLATINLHLGRSALARAEYEAIAADGFVNIRADGEFLACLAALAELCASFEDAAGAGELLRILRPHAGLHAVLGPVAGHGSVAYFLGLLAQTASRFDEAADYFEQALAANYRTDARIFAAYTRVEYAAMLLRCGARGDLVKASRLLSGLQAYAEAIGMKALAARVSALGEEFHTELLPAALVAGRGLLPVEEDPEQRKDFEFIPLRFTPSPDKAIERIAHQGQSDSTANPDRALDLLVHKSEQPFPAAATALVRDGDYWTIEYDGQRLRLKHLKGLTCLAVLLANPDTEVHSLSLATITERDAADGSSSEIAAAGGQWNGLGDAGPMLDSRAKSEYKRRLTELRAELDDAREAGDDERIVRAEDELDFIEAEVSRAVGLGGRSRVSASAGERARVSVTKSIKSAVAKIAQQNRDLGAYLAATVRTGTFCRYTPNPDLGASARSA